MNDESKPEDDSEFLRVKDAAAIGKTSSRTIWRMIADGQLTAYRFRRCTRLLRSQVLGYFKGNGKVGGV
jgi:excisionase family DNA binding protein